MPSGSSPREVPSNIPYEDAVLGACLLSRDAVSSIIDMITPGDFYQPRNQRIFSAVVALSRRGEAVDPLSVRTELTALGLAEHMDFGELVELQADCPSTANALHYARGVVTESVRRRLIAAYSTGLEQAYSPTEDVLGIGDLVAAQVAEAYGGIISDDVSDLYTIDEFLDRPQEERSGWVIPGIVRRGWRAMIVAPEGTGKSVCIRQMAMAAAQGIHPFNFTPIDPIVSLIVDLENPDDSIDEVCNPIRAQARFTAGDAYDPNKAWLWWRQDGIDLRNRRDRSEFESVISAVQPDLVCLGPIYKSYVAGDTEKDEQAVRQVQAVLDYLRVTYSFALVMEHHAPHGTSGKSREIRPHGSVLWKRWPELGLSLSSQDDTGSRLKVGRFRGDRLLNAWPSELERTAMSDMRWPWRGVWPTGSYAPGGPPPRAQNYYEPNRPDDDDDPIPF